MAVRFRVRSEAAGYALAAALVREGFDQPSVCRRPWAFPRRWVVFARQPPPPDVTLEYIEDWLGRMVALGAEVDGQVDGWTLDRTPRRRPREPSDLPLLDLALTQLREQIRDLEGQRYRSGGYPSAFDSLILPPTVGADYRWGLAAIEDADLLLQAIVRLPAWMDDDTLFWSIRLRGVDFPSQDALVGAYCTRVSTLLTHPTRLVPCGWWFKRRFRCEVQEAGQWTEAGTSVEPPRFAPYHGWGVVSSGPALDEQRSI